MVSRKPDSGPHELPRRDRRALAGMFAVAFLLAATAIGYVGVQQAKIADLENQTRGGICTILVTSAASGHLTPARERAYIEAGKPFGCRYPFKESP
jgi:hypothetical protein